jgi:hypothetical protein
MSKEVKTNQDLIDNVFNDMISSQQGEAQGVEDNGVVNDSDNPVADGDGQESDEGIEPVTNNESNISEDTDGDDKATETVAETADPVVDSTDTELNLFDDWDSDQTNPNNTDTEIHTVDYSDIANELGIEGKSKDSIIEAYNKLKGDAKLVEDYKSLPKDLVQAIELAKQGQDHTIIFKSEEAINHSKFDDRTLLVNHNSKYFTDMEGNVDSEALQEYVDDMTEIQQKIEATKVRESIDEYNRVKKEGAVKQKLEDRQKAQTELQNVISHKDEVKGFKVKPEHKEEAFKKISSGEAIKEMFMKNDGSYDMDKLFETYFIVKNFDKMKNFLTRKSSDESRARDFNQVSNANPNVRQTPANPGEQKPKNLMDEYLESLKSKVTGNIDN